MHRPCRPSHRLLSHQCCCKQCAQGSAHVNTFPEHEHKHRAGMYCAGIGLVLHPANPPPPHPPDSPPSLHSPRHVPQKSMAPKKVFPEFTMVVVELLGLGPRAWFPREGGRPGRSCLMCCTYRTVCHRPARFESDTQEPSFTICLIVLYWARDIGRALACVCSVGYLTQTSPPAVRIFEIPRCMGFP